MKIILLVCLIFFYITLCESYSTYHHETLGYHRPRYFRHRIRHGEDPHKDRGTLNSWQRYPHRHHHYGHHDHHRHYARTLTDYPSDQKHCRRGWTRYHHHQPSINNFKTSRRESESDFRNHPFYSTPRRHVFRSHFNPNVNIDRLNCSLLTQKPIENISVIELRELTKLCANKSQQNGIDESQKNEPIDFEQTMHRTETTPTPKINEHVEMTTENIRNESEDAMSSDFNDNKDITETISSYDFLTNMVNVVPTTTENPKIYAFQDISANLQK